MSSTLVIAGAVGALYAWATMLPFVLISQVGLTPTEFGIGMLMQSGLFFSGTVTMRLMMRRFTPQALVPAVSSSSARRASPSPSPCMRWNRPSSR